jgi:hypothetical protein
MRSRIFSRRMDNCQNIEVCCRCDAIDNQVRQPSNLEFKCFGNITFMSEQRKLFEHHHCLSDARNDSLCRHLIVLGDPVADAAQIILRLWRKINVQGRDGARCVRQESSSLDPWLVLNRVPP